MSRGFVEEGFGLADWDPAGPGVLSEPADTGMVPDAVPFAIPTVGVAVAGGICDPAAVATAEVIVGGSGAEADAGRWLEEIDAALGGAACLASAAGFLFNMMITPSVAPTPVSVASAAVTTIVLFRFSGPRLLGTASNVLLAPSIATGATAGMRGEGAGLATGVEGTEALGPDGVGADGVGPEGGPAERSASGTDPDPWRRVDALTG